MAALGRQTGNDDGGRIAVLDVAKVFKENKAFNQQIEAIQAQAQKLKAEVEGKQQNLQQKAHDISEKYNINTPERKSEEAKLEQDMTALRTYARQSETELMAAEAKVYYDTYQKMSGFVSEFAKQYKISLVLRFDSSECNAGDRNDVIKMVNRPVVYQSSSDITTYVIEKMNNVQTANAGVNTK